MSTEHSYRSDLQVLIKSIVPDVMVTNEPTRVACGAPDYIITKKNVPVGYIEAKDIGKSLDSPDYKEQFDRYRKSLTNLIITDYLEFRLYREGTFVLSVTIGEVSGNKIIPRPEQFVAFDGLIRDFCIYISQTIKSASKLSKMMAGKARLMSSIIEKALNPDESESIINEPQNLNLHSQFESFKNVLIHDITEKTFADIYAQTIAYGMFAARFHDPSLENFTRQEAAELIPKSNPFLRKLFQYIAGYDLDDRIKWIVDDLADIFRATNVNEVLKDFGKATEQRDPMIHFYETFLAEYDPKLRKSRGVYYTPEPVVNFIVRAVDDFLKDEFGITQGLADTSKVKIKIKDVTKSTPDLRSKTKEIERVEEVHRVQILDPAAGTGTFLAEVIKQIYKKFKGQQGVWSKYVEDHLIPRLNGFEILMASYAMAHLKLEMLLNETGHKSTKDQRLKIYLTNSLEVHHPDTGTLFASWLSAEANEANYVKKDTPVMVVLGNPPYSVSSSNKSQWIQELMSDYKHNLNERNIQPLSDDYIKFIRFGQHYIEKNGVGIIAYISNNSFTDGIIHRQMRKELLECFDSIYILDLHGNSKKKETCLDGSRDENVFDIMQGVSINVFVRKRNLNKKQSTKVYHLDIYGSRQEKYDFLTSTSCNSISWNPIQPQAPNYFFVETTFKGSANYEKGIKVDDLFPTFNTGIETGRDDFFIDYDVPSLEEKVKNVFNNRTDTNLLSKYKITNSSGFRFWERLLNHDFDEKKVRQIMYRPFDLRFTYYEPNLQRRASYNTMKHLMNNNLALNTCRQQSTFDFQHVLITSIITERCTVSLQTKETGYVFPLYVYPDYSTQQAFSNQPERIPNLDMTVVKNISDTLGLIFSAEKASNLNSFAPIDLLDYIYAVLYSPTYRKLYKHFLKIDFPRISYPKDKKTFWQLVKLGGELRQIHLLESPVVEKYITTYTVTGNNEVGKIKYEDNKVWTNSNQYFDKVPEVAWNFYIGGYQPAQKWLKDRKGRVLSFEDIMHYQKIIVALKETDRIMKEIDKINFLGP
ncbi:MAG: type ISP restriction/modification enzyme [Bacteroidota bacterium]